MSLIRKKRILIVMPVFGRELLALNSIKSVCDNTKSDNSYYNAHIVVAINDANDDLKSVLKTLPVEVVDFGENLGKGIAVNKVAAMYDFDYLVSIDSDMICLSDSWLRCMLTSYELINNESKFTMGSLCTQQLGNSCHKVTLGENGCISINLNDLAVQEQRKYLDPMHVTRYDTDAVNLISQDNDGGIAGGVLMTDNNTWNLIGGYRATKLYGTDDGFYHAECQRHKRLVGYLDNVQFYHPYEFLDDYNKWKFGVAASDEEFVPHETKKVHIKFNHTGKK